MTTRTLAPCGTPAAYQRHRYRGQDPDESCRRAWREYSTNRQRTMRTEDRGRRRERQANADAKAVQAAEQILRQREPRMVHLPGGDVLLGVLAGTSKMHAFVPDSGIGTSCAVCFSWSDDYRHLGKPVLVGSAA